MDDVRAHETMPQLDGLIVEEEPLDNATRRYLAYLTRTRPFRLHFDVAAPLLKQELAMRWPVEPGMEPQASALRHQIEHFIEPLTANIHPAAPIRMMVNVGPHPEVQAPFPDAPAVYAAFDAARGVVRHRLAAANEIPLDAWVEGISRGLVLLCQPTEINRDQFPIIMGHRGNLYELAPRELNETEEWRQLHSRSVVVPMMPPTAKASYEEIPQDPQHASSLPGMAALAGAALFVAHEVKEHSTNSPTNAAEATKKYQGAAQQRQKEDDNKTAEKTKQDAAALAEETAMLRTEMILNQVKRDERLIRENPDLSSELAALRESAAQLRGVLTDGDLRAQAEADIRDAESQYITEKEPETVYDEGSNPQQIFLGMPEKETEVQESEQAREDAEHFPEEITQAGEYARIADLNPDAAAAVTQQPEMRKEAVAEGFQEPVAKRSHRPDTTPPTPENAPKPEPEI